MTDKRETNEVDLPSGGGIQPEDLPNGPPAIEATLEVIEGKKKHRLKLDISQGAVQVGREDADTPIAHVDMAPYDGLQRGVSRTHALLRFTKRGVFIADLNSTNGTRINGFKLEPERQYLLRNGDEIEFGQLRTVIRLKH